MKPEAISYFVCPECHGDLKLHAQESGEIIDGDLECLACALRYPIKRGVPRFAGENEAYTDTFGRQWNRWDRTQHDSLNGTSIYRDRMKRYTDWTPESFTDQVVVDAGCGAGAYLDVVERNARAVIGFDLSSAIDAAYRLHGARPNVHLAQGDIFKPPVRPAIADRLYTFGVVQHTPDPERAFRSLMPLVRPGGEIAVWVYRRTLIPQPVYLMRMFTKRLQEPQATQFIEWFVPRALRLSGLLGRIPKIGSKLRRLVPVADYRERLPSLTPAQQLEWALMDTHDGLITRYTFPQRWSDLKRWMDGCVDIRKPDQRETAAVGRVPSPPMPPSANAAGS